MNSDDIVDVVVLTVVAVICSADDFIVPLLLLLTMALALVRVDLSEVAADVSGVVVVTVITGDIDADSSIIVLQVT